MSSPRRKTQGTHVPFILPHVPEVKKVRLTISQDWWFEKATELQKAADRKDFFEGLKKIYGPTKKGVTSCKSVLNRPFVADENIIVTIFQSPEIQEMYFEQDSITQISSGKAPGNSTQNLQVWC